MNTWHAYTGRPFDLAGAALEQHWPTLHAGNLEPYPAEAAVQDAWRAYHEGRFEAAVELGKAHGGLGLVPAAFAATIYAHYLEQEEAAKVAIFESAIELASVERMALPLPDKPSVGSRCGCA